MPFYGIPGVAVNRERSRLVGAISAVTVVVAVLAVIVVTRGHPGGQLRLDLRTEQIGDGIVAGTYVRLDGVEIGRVGRVRSSGQGQQLITLELDESRLATLDDSLTVDYAPANLFGISELDVKRGSGGRPLRSDSVIDLAGAQAHKVDDVTMGELLRSLTATTTKVLTPKLATVLTTVAGDLRAFTPIIAAIVDTSRSIADTQFLLPSFVLSQYGSTLAGAGPLVTGTIGLLNHFNRNEILRRDRARFDAGVAVIEDNILPALTNLLNTSQPYFNGYTDMAAPLLNLAAQTVPTPHLSSVELTQLLARLDKSFTPTPGGATLKAQIVLQSVPAVAQPLLGALAAQPRRPR